MHAIEKENVANACITIEKWANFLLVSSQMILKKLTIEASNDSFKSIKNEDAGGNHNFFYSLILKYYSIKTYLKD